MSRSTVKGSKRPDWAALCALIEQIDTQQTTDELGAAWHRGEIPEPRWAPEYVPALQAALEQRKPEELLALLDAGLLIHPVLLPTMAQVLRGVLYGRMSGRPVKLVEIQVAGLIHLFEHIVGPGKERAEDFYAEWGERLDVSPETIKRAVRPPKR
ncbi:hypothetical protein [Rhizobacter sp. Root404]|uniref:hypothetical protein n=1 Tax=Rhizobacter sp. Root404 TaxID=1736528 RepID=UPI0006FDC6E9|nr:hypothetical protein [Rhizobacter sp. Root404]KQW36509.1 hypothetical protein ASC76_17745 [Rhizobacter sp. Root404]